MISTVLPCVSQFGKGACCQQVNLCLYSFFSYMRGSHQDLVLSSSLLCLSYVCWLWEIPVVCSQTLQPLGTDVMSSLAPICSSNSVGGRTGVNIVFIKYQFIQVLINFKSFNLDLISKKK